MTEWLTENAHRAYPLEHVAEWPADTPDGVQTMLRDACVGYAEVIPDEDRILLIDVCHDAEKADVVSIRVGIDDSRCVAIDLSAGSGKYDTVFGAGSGFKVLLTVDNVAVRGILDSGWFGTAAVNAPFSLRCVSSANRMVTAVEAYSPENPCDRPVFDPEKEKPVRVLTKDVVLVAKSGIDLDTYAMMQFTEDLLRITAITAPKEADETDKPVDMMIRGDECIEVETIPGVHDNGDGVLIPLTNPEAGGVVRITDKCKPCCQCEDYENAVNVLRPWETATFEVESMLNEAKDAYNKAVDAFNRMKDEAVAEINDYSRVIMAATAVTSGNMTTKVVAEGTRCRIAMNMTVINMTSENVTISGVGFVVPEYGNTPVKVRWNTAGSMPQSGESLSYGTWLLQPGDTLSVTATYVKTATTNTAVKPQGMQAEMRAKLPSREEKQYRVNVQ